MQKTLLTVGDLVRLAGQPIHKIEYIISSRNIEPVQRAGRFRLFDDASVQRVKDELAKMNRRGS